MATQQQIIENVKRNIRLPYHELKWLSEEESKRANRERDKLLKSLADKVNYGFKQSKTYSGDLSPGCLSCGEGRWSCMYINRLCTAACFFCLEDRKIKKERPPETDRIVFDNPIDYIDYLEKFGFKGVGFSGGECMLVFEMLLSYLKKIRQRLGKKIYTWIYTNGDLVDEDKLTKLRRAGLDEIRFNISARNYDLQPVELATKYIKAVAVEIPVIPDDHEVLKKCLLKMQKMGVNYLNIHQLITSKHNYRNYVNRNYTFLHQSWIPILESEMIALKLLKYALDNNIRLSINYCSQAYKERFQGRGHRNRAAVFAREDFEGVTDSGYIRRLTIRDSLANLKNIVKVLEENKCKERLWLLDETKAELSIHHSLLKYINFKKFNIILSYFNPQLKENISSQGNYKEIRLNANKKVFAKRELVAQSPGLSSKGIESFQKLFIENMNSKDVFKYFYENYNLKSKESIAYMVKEAEILKTLRTWEKLAGGFPKIF